MVDVPKTKRKLKKWYIKMLRAEDRRHNIRLKPWRGWFHMAGHIIQKEMIVREWLLFSAMKDGIKLFWLHENSEEFYK